MTDSQSIKVCITKRPDKKFWSMYFSVPGTRKRETRSTGTQRKKEALKIAGAWEQQLRTGTYKPTGRISWDEFRELYATEYMEEHLRESTQRHVHTSLNHLERIIGPSNPRMLDSAVISKFSKALSEKYRAPTVNTHLRRDVRRFLGWANCPANGVLKITARLDPNQNSCLLILPLVYADNAL